MYINKIKLLFCVINLILIIVLCFMLFKKIDKNNHNIDNVYGYAAIDTEGKSKLIELNSNSKNKEIVNYSGEIFNLYLEDNKLYYYVYNDLLLPHEKYKLIYIDLEDDSLSPVELLSLSGMRSFVVVNEYIFLFGELSGIQIYNLKTGQEINLVNEMYVVYLFVNDLDEKLQVYFYTGLEPWLDVMENHHDYYLMEFSKNNNEIVDLKKITENEYINNSQNLQNIIENKEIYFIYNNKNISLSKDNTQLIYDNKVIYETKDNKQISFMYTLEYGQVGFMEYQIDDYQKFDYKYYIYDFSKESIKEVSGSDLYNLKLLLK